MALGTEHRHCKVCGKVCGPDEQVCSRKCRDRREEAIRSKRSLTYLLYGGMAVVLLLLVLSFAHV